MSAEPSPGALRAVEAIDEANVTRLLQTREPITRGEADAIIDRETGAKELADALYMAREHFDALRAMIAGTPEKQDLELAWEQAEASSAAISAVLAKHAKGTS